MIPEWRSSVKVNERNCGAVIAVILASLILVLCCFIGFESGAQSIRREAARNGHARYVIDDNGQPKFEWK